MEFTLWRSLFWIPPIGSSIMLLLTWRSGLILRPGIVAAFWGVALVFQGLAGLLHRSGSWDLCSRCCCDLPPGLKLGVPS